MPCSCPDPRSCTCRGTQNTSRYPTMYHLPHNIPSYIYPPYGPPPMAYPSSNHHGPQPAAFQHVFQANYQGAQSQAPSHQEPAAFRVALADTTSTVVNWTTPQTTHPQPATKRKRTQADGGRASKRANTGSAAASSSSTRPTQPPLVQSLSPSVPLVIPAIHGVGPQSAPPPSNTASSPVTRKPGPSSSRGSLLATTSGTNNAGATDVWYFVRGLKECKAHEPTQISTSYLRPDSKEFPFLGCTLCQYGFSMIWANLWLIFLFTDIPTSGECGRMLATRLRPFGNIFNLTTSYGKTLSSSSSSSTGKKLQRFSGNVLLV